jgi:hypothetical protein
MTFGMQETVTITDPCHPLYDQTFPLLFTTKYHNYEPCCMIQISPEADRLIPIRQTNLSTPVFHVFPSPLDISSLHRFIETFTRIGVQVERKCRDEFEGANTGTRGKDPSTTGMENSGCSSAASSIANNRQSLPTDHPDLGKRANQ